MPSRKAGSAHYLCEGQCVIFTKIFCEKRLKHAPNSVMTYIVDMKFEKKSSEKYARNIKPKYAKLLS